MAMLTEPFSKAALFRQDFLLVDPGLLSPHFESIDELLEAYDNPSHKERFKRAAETVGKMRFAAQVNGNGNGKHRNAHASI